MTILKGLKGSLLVLGVVAVISACSGGGGSTSDTEPPGITGTEPVNGSTGVPQHPLLSVTFDEEMDPITIGATTFILKDASDNPVSGTVRYSSSVATFTPDSGLDYLATYTATVTTGMTDQAGNHLRSDLSWTFTTTSAPQVLATSPSALQGQLLASLVIEVTFNRNVNAATINSSSFTVSDAGLNPVSGAINTSGATTTFTPAAPLEYNTTYTATLSTDVTDTAGNNLPADYVWSFSTIGLLGNAASIASSSDNVSCVKAIFDSNDNGYVIWNQGPDYSSESVWANRYSSGSGWDTAAAIESSSTDIWGCPAISADSAGNLVAVWSQGGVITMNRYTSGSGWGTAETVGGAAGISPRVAMDASSNIFVVWEDAKNIWARRYEHGIGWDTATTIETYSTEAYAPDVVVDSSGDATVVWAQQQVALLFFAAANRYTAGVGWGTPTMISSSASGLLNNTVLAEVTDSGHVFAAWSMGSDTFTLRANRYLPGVGVGFGWGTEATIDPDLTSSAVSPSIATAGDDVTIVWNKFDNSIHSATYLNGSGWQAASVLVNDGSVANPKIAISNAGKVTLAWSHELWNGTEWEYGARGKQYTAASGWSEMQLLTPNNSRSFGMDLTSDSSGNFLAAWTEGPGPTADVVKANIFQ